MAINWTEAKVKKLAKLWGKNIPARDIAEKLGEGITRNAVIGKANRLGLTKDLKPKSIKSSSDNYNGGYVTIVPTTSKNSFYNAGEQERIYGKKKKHNRNNITLGHKNIAI